MKFKKVKNYCVLCESTGYNIVENGYGFEYGGVKLIVGKFKGVWNVTHAESGLSFGLVTEDHTKNGSIERFLKTYPTEEGFYDYISKLFNMDMLERKYGKNPYWYGEVV